MIACFIHVVFYRLYGTASKLGYGGMDMVWRKKNDNIYGCQI